MSHSTNESDDGMLSKDQNSPSIDEDSSGGGLSVGVVLKKGPWTSAEDAILVEYVKKHGEGNWNAVQKHSGLFRCGKSCRLRWANHLRPNLKKGAFTADEERTIIELHAKMGNKWARMAAHLPGRTDNEIKNYWNTRIKRRQRAGLPLYPPDVCLQALNESQQNQNGGEFGNGDARHHNLLQENNYDIPDVVFDNLKANQGTISYSPTFSDFSIGNMLSPGLGSSQSYSFILPPTGHRPKRLRESENLLPGFPDPGVPHVLPQFDQFQTNTCEKIPRLFGLGLPYEPDPNGKNPTPFGGVGTGSHALLNGNFSASKPITGAVKVELPSLQYPETDLSSWGTPPLLSFEAVDNYIQSPPSSLPVQSDCVSPRNSGLLEALIHESHTMASTKNQSSEKSSNSSVVTPSDVMDSSALNVCETGWEDYGDPISPLGRSAASVFNECTPPISGTSFDDSSPAKALLPGFSLKEEKVEHVLTSSRGKEIPTRPDALLGSDWFVQSSECGKSQSVMTDAIETLLGEDFCSDYKHIYAGTSSTLNQGWGLGSCAWNNMPAVCQMSDFP